ncbi:MAG: phosphate acetyltransferase [Clostridiales bacterium]|nr:phosphate acetyltransferase [Clostridiales bacterium]
MSFIDDMKQKAKNEIKTIVLPEATDVRTLEATEQIGKEEFAKVVLVGNKEEILKVAKENNFDISKAEIVEPKTSEKYEEYSNSFYELRKNKGMTIEKANELMLDPVYFGMMMLKQGDADGLVSGAAHSTADTLRPALQIIKTAPGTKLVSTFSFMVVPNCEFGDNGVFVFSDCGLNPNPNAEELSEIAISSANSYKQLTSRDARVAMLSFSSYGSASSPEVEKVQQATAMAKEKAPELALDGELQLDAAIVPEVGQSKAPGSKVAGTANTLIFPDLQAGNIGYKLVERLGKAEAYGPICQGIAKPVNDLSRGCKAADIVGVVAITAVQAQ